VSQIIIMSHETMFQMTETVSPHDSIMQLTW